MSSSAITTSQIFAAQQVILYGGISILITGVIGGFLNIIVFLSLQTFRQNSCAFYLTIMSIVNIGQLLTGLLSRITITGFSIDWTQISLFYCKFRYFIFQTCALLSFTCICLATIDQYFATCFRPYWQQFCNIKLSHRIIIVFMFFWMIHGIPYLIFYNHVKLPNSEMLFCTSTNEIFLQYHTYIFLLTLTGILPVFITGIFGFLAYYNVRHIAYRTVPLVRRELDKQMTVMVLVQVVLKFFTIVPFIIVNTLAFNTSITQDPIIVARIQLAGSVVVCLYYAFFASPFYIYICVSERFRQQFIHVIFKIYINRWSRQKMNNNQVIPQA
ncbi:unnamed protein product [Rotaria sp. Silwood1]|nr:unnamed protein product [Rotaria sp. Silwood1]CAF1225192.1 unnamed protein product [Rotaria sp. Silwood1]CAF3566446.1 unnamed protein product [Rotaria sp. Silwood1]CAF3696512.1 unnamed protein product [Rotaria sp. Silwood1]CAF4712880.1 unnamed protein product [Rotaria sp. Silwood1]